MDPGLIEIDHNHFRPHTCVEELRNALGSASIRSDAFLESLPFSVDDATAGSETELQAAVYGGRESVDLPLIIEQSNYFQNIVRRAGSGDASRKAVTDLERYLYGNTDDIWENSWVRFPLRNLTDFARRTVHGDLRAEKRNPAARERDDAAKFLFTVDGDQWLRVPISYLLKISLADVIGSQPDLPRLIAETGRGVMPYFMNDNTSPETLSFCVTPIRRRWGAGRALAKETAKRFLFAHLLVMYANSAFGPAEYGQRATVYFSPHPPIRQKELNESISDSFYRELFMSPCLSGWDDGQAKHEYMCLCHQVLSRSRLNAMAKLKEAGVIPRNFVVLPNVSNISLANNGTHVSLGSLKLTRLFSDPSSKVGEHHEKYVGDLVIKIVEHFLPLFVGSYSAAPYRLDFSDFHPETVLGFLPHQLDYTHLRMIWRRWKRKAKLKIFGQPLTPFGLKGLDDAISSVFRVKGDYVPDFRLIDYMVTPMSTDRSPALDGRLGNTERLKQDLADLGVFDTRMALYALYRLRQCRSMGFSGFEARHYSLFESLEQDLSEAVDLQVLVTALAFAYALRGTFTHAHIPDDPYVESERRQIFFGAAIGLPTFYVRSDTSNLFLKHLIQRTEGVRYSRRYPGYLRVYHRQFRLTAARLIQKDAEGLIEMLGMKGAVDNLIRRMESPAVYSAESRLTRTIVDALDAPSPIKTRARDFNRAAEAYYRTDLKKRHLGEALRFVDEDLREIERERAVSDERYSDALRHCAGPEGSLKFLRSMREGVREERLSSKEIRRLVNLLLVTVRRDAERAEDELRLRYDHEENSASICRAGDRRRTE